ncbi:MAG: DNA-methyltransferase [Candidatus Hodarchaeales archaeon]
MKKVDFGKYGVAYCGDCLEVMPTLDKVDCILTDVPYKQEFHGRGMAKNRPNYAKIKEYGSDVNLDYRQFLMSCLSILKEKNFFTFCDKETKYDFITYAKELKYGYKELSFCKTSPTPFTNNQWLADQEYGVHIFKDLKVRGDYSTKRSFSILNNLREKEEKNHPSPKRISEIQRILKNITDIDGLICDPFAGSGTLAESCIKEDRRFIIIEKDPEYFDICVQRIKEAIIERESMLF